MTLQEQELLADAKWNILRSEIYVRDKGICWCCHRFVLLEDYHLGHLIDRTNGGPDKYENLAVMHKSCNVNKPRHVSFEEVTRWRNTYDLGIRPSPGIISEAETNMFSPTLQPTVIIDRQPKQRTTKLPSAYIMAKREQAYQDQCERITPGTITWIQGRPMGGPMWRVFPPPYIKSVSFTMRRTPPGAVDNGASGIDNTVQVIGGTLLTEASVESGYITYQIKPIEGGAKLVITGKANEKSNTNNGSNKNTVGLGVNQISVEEWHTAKSFGIPYTDFVSSYQKDT